MIPAASIRSAPKLLNLLSFVQLTNCSVPPLPADARAQSDVADVVEGSTVSDVWVAEDVSPFVWDVSDPPRDASARRLARIEFARVAEPFLDWDSVEAEILVPQGDNGAGVTWTRSGECLVENQVFPALERFADHLVFNAGGVDRDVPFRDNFQTMWWSERGRAFGDANDLTFRATRANLPMGWTFTTGIPQPRLVFTGPPGIELRPNWPIALRLSDRLEFRWTPTNVSHLVRLQFDSGIVVPGMPFTRSILRCTYHPSLGVSIIRLADHTDWLATQHPANEVVLTIDALTQSHVAYGDIVVEVNAMHRHGVFGVMLEP